MKARFIGFPVLWSPYPGTFYAGYAKSFEMEQASVFLARGLLFEDRKDALTRSRELNAKLELGDPSYLPEPIT